MSGSGLPIEKGFALSIQSVLSTCVFTSILIVLLILLFKQSKVLLKIGPKFMIGVFLIIIFRMFMPIEFPFTYDIVIEEKLTPFLKWMKYAVITTPFEIKIWQILLYIWFLGIVVSLIYRLIKYRQFVRYISIMNTVSIETLKKSYRLYDEVCEGLKKVRVVRTKHTNHPYLVGLKNSCIVLPEMTYTDEQMNYILLHELQHVYNKDIAWKIVIDVLCTLFWWNPVFYYLRKEFSRLIELRNDEEIIKNLSETEQVAYMQCLKDSVENLTGKNLSFGVAFSKNDKKELKLRLKLISDNNKNLSKAVQVIFGILFVIMILGTASFVVEPSTIEGTNDEQAILLTEENTYLIINGDEYDVYINGAYAMTIDNLVGFENVKVYECLEEVNDD